MTARCEPVVMPPAPTTNNATQLPTLLLVKIWGVIWITPKAAGAEVIK